MSEELKSKFEDGFNRYFSSGRLMTSPAVNLMSLCSASITMLRGELILAKGIGFFWRQADDIALVTAWHNFSGLHHTQRTCLHSQGALPDRIRVRFMAIEPKAFQEIMIPLYLDDELIQPRWFVHPEVGSYFDICFLRLKVDNPVAFACVNDHFKTKAERIEPGSDAFIVGFPHGAGLMGIFPVWKRASIATELSMPVDGHPKFLVDSAGRSGMSGSPVYRITRGWTTETTSAGVQAMLGETREFLGLYSGRVASPVSAGESSDLGFVWREDILCEALASATLDEQPEPHKGTVKIEEFFGPPHSSEPA